MQADDISMQQLRWQCRRGMLELDLIFEAFLDNGYGKLSAQQKQLFQALLLNSDQELQSWMTGKTKPEEMQTSELIKLIRQSV